VKKNSLVKIRKLRVTSIKNFFRLNLQRLFEGLCNDCSHNLNFHHKRKEVTKKKKTKKETKSKRSSKDRRKSEGEPSTEEPVPGPSKDGVTEAGVSSSAASSKTHELNDSTDIWREGQQTTEEKSRDEEFEEFLEDLFL